MKVCCRNRFWSGSDCVRMSRKNSGSGSGPSPDCGTGCLMNKRRTCCFRCRSCLRSILNCCNYRCFRKTRVLTPHCPRLWFRTSCSECNISCCKKCVLRWKKVWSLRRCLAWRFCRPSCSLRRQGWKDASSRARNNRDRQVRKGTMAWDHKDTIRDNTVSTGHTRDHTRKERTRPSATGCPKVTRKGHTRRGRTRKDHTNKGCTSRVCSTRWSRLCRC